MSSFKRFLPLYAVVFLGFFGYALTLTLFIPMLMDKHYLLVPATTTVSQRAFLTGLLLAVYPLGQFIGSPIIGTLSDNFGRKKVLLISLMICILGFIAIGYSVQQHMLSALFIASFITGLCESNMAISQSVIADSITDEHQKTKLIGYIYSACSLGYIVGPLVAGLSGSISYSFPFWVAAAGVGIVTAWVWLSFRSKSQINPHQKIAWLESLTSIKAIFTNRKLRRIYLINFAIFFSVMGLYRIAPLYVVDKYHPSLHIYSLLIAYVSGICFLANLFLLSPISKRYNTKTLLAGTLIIGAIFVTSIIIPSHFHWIWLTFGLAVIPTVMALPTCTSWLSQQASPSEQGRVMGNNQALLVLGEATSAALGGAIAAIYVPLPIMLVAAILLFAGIAVIAHKEK